MPWEHSYQRDTESRMISARMSDTPVRNSESCTLGSRVVDLEEQTNVQERVRQENNDAE